VYLLLRWLASRSHLIGGVADVPSYAKATEGSLRASLAGRRLEARGGIGRLSRIYDPKMATSQS
jgi:hypothetical protein